jgi:signal transduction histidine kinase
LSIKAKQVAGVTSLVVIIVAIMSGWQMATLMRLRLDETFAGATLLKDALFQRTTAVLATGPDDAYAAIRDDGGIRSILEASVAYSKNQHILYVAIAAPDGTAIVHGFRFEEGKVLPYRENFAEIVDLRAIDQFLSVISERQFEVKEPLFMGERQFANIRVGVSTLLIGGEMKAALWNAAQTAVAAMLASMLVAMVLTQWMLRPIHVIQSGLSRLGRGELDVTLDLPEQEFKDLGSSFDAVSAQLSAVRAKAPGVAGDFESVMENLEDAVALFAPRGELVFSNAAMRALLPTLAAPGVTTDSAVASLSADHPVRQLVERALAGRKSQGPVSMPLGPPAEPDQEAPERLLLCHAIEDSSGRFLGAMLVARNVGYLTQVHTTLNFSRKLAALGRLMAGVAHEVKNPLNAMTIHLELLKQKLMIVGEPVAVAAGSGRVEPRPLDLTKHVNIISDEIKRLDQVVVGFLKFARPDELKLQPLQVEALINEVMSMTMPEAERNGVAVKVDCSSDVPDINADPGMLQQALLNLAINACQAMPNGGTLRIGCRRASRRRVEVDVEDTGVGIPPENLSRIFDLYFTTKEKGSGIGLSMVFRIVQLHDGEVEVQSTPGRGTRFRLTFPQA